MVFTETGKRRWVFGALIILLVMAWGLRMRGIEWPLLHPDEYKISSWATWIEEHSKTQNPAYPGGYFHLIKPLLLAKNALLEGGAAWQAFLGHGDLLDQSAVNQTFLLRKINVGFALLTVLLFYGLAFCVTRSRVGALAAAAFLGLSCLHVEHSHYAETDIVMIFTLTLALYGWARVYEGRRVGWFLVAALLTGLAIGTKYTNLLLFPCWIGGLVVCVKAGTGEKCWRRWAGLVLAGILLLAAGWVYTNRHVLAGTEFWVSLKRACELTYGERHGLLGQSQGDPWAVLRSNWNTLTDHLADINGIWLAVFLLGAGLAFLPRYRRYGLVTWFPLGLYLFYFLGVAPWVRGQEFMVFFPFAAVCMAIAVKESLNWAGRTKHRTLAVVGVASLLLGAGFQSGILAMRWSSLFEMPEARVQAKRWLYVHAPFQKRVGVEDYTFPALTLFDSVAYLGQIEWMSPEQRAQSKMDYLLRNVFSTGRGTMDPRTRELYPNYAANLAAFQKQAGRLCAWGPCAPRYAFVGHQMEWWESRRESALQTFESPLFRPILVDHLHCVTVPATGSGVGSEAGLFVDTIRRYLVVGGNNSVRRTLYVVLQTQERAADLVVSGMGDRHTVHLDPYDVAVVPVKRPWFLPRISVYDVISIRAKPLEHIQYLPCYAQVAIDVRDVAMLLFQKGYADHALPWLSRGAAPVGGEWLRYACAVEQNDWALADSLESVARQQREKMEKVRALLPGQLILNGGTGTGYQEHSRIRLPLPDTGRDGVKLTVSPIPLHFEKEENETQFKAQVTLPVRLTPGCYTIRGAVKSRLPLEWVQPFSITVGDSLQKSVEPVVMDSGKKSEWVRRIKVDREQNVTLYFASEQHGGWIDLSEIEIRWNENGLLWPELTALYKAMMAHALHRGDTGVLNALLKQARESVPDDQGWARFEKRGAAQLGSGQVGLGVFYPWVKLMAMEPVSRGVIRLRFEILKDNPPPLKVFAYIRFFKGSHKFVESPIPSQGRMKGDVMTLDIAKPPDNKLSEIGLRLTADEPWVFSPLSVEGTSDGRLWLKE